MEYTEILEKQIIGRLRVDNPWWTENVIPQFYRDMTPRIYIDIFYPLVSDLSVRRALILMGPRRVGKTVMIFHTVQKLIDSGVSPQNIIYISVETPIYNNIYLEQLLNLAKQALNKPERDNATYYVFFDEIQYLKEWEVNLKSLVDTYRNMKFIASGSAAAELKKKSDESGAGRFTDFNLPPLTFYEYIHLKDYKQLLSESEILWHGHKIPCNTSVDIDKLNALFIDYINYGGYPEVVFSDKIRENPGQFVRHDIIDKVLLRDLPSLYGISDVQELNSFFTMIAYHSGKQFSYEALSKESGVRKDLLKKYIEYLEAAFLIKVIHRTDDTAKNYQRETSFKIYLTNPSLRCALFQPIKETDEEIGNMVETAVYAQWIPRIGTNISYANWNFSRKDRGEVDIVGINPAKLKPEWAVEVKWSDRYYEKPDDLTSLKTYMERNSMDYAMVTTKTTTGMKEMPFGILQFLPVACYAYTVGENTLKSTKASFGL
ncbi:MAG: ATP-binding protein [Bacteroidales bacterium]|jgi:predicted AAA+ superfamily ATPase|nr:ATP-binding protein [Bacteroidales bacterium]MCI2145729.1 ATP-binding protein [Bacteroidales bacterium]